MVNKAQLKRQAQYQRDCIMLDTKQKNRPYDELTVMLGALNRAESRQEDIPQYYSPEYFEEKGGVK